MAVRLPLTGEDIIADSLGRAPDVQLGNSSSGWRLCRWRQFVGSYALPSLPDPLFVVHIAGKPQVRTWQRDGWSETASIPGCATIVPSGQPTGWLVDGELDVVTLSVDSAELRQAPAADQFRTMQFAFADPLGVALTRQVLAELYAPAADGREAYVGALVGALKAHMLRGPAAPVAIPTADFSAYRLHSVMNHILAAPEAPHSIEELAALAGVSPSHFCRVFRQATGESPHRYVLKARIDRAKQLLLQSESPIRHVGEAVGFQTQADFARAFRRETGEPPSAFRQRQIDRPGRRLQ